MLSPAFKTWLRNKTYTASLDYLAYLSTVIYLTYTGFLVRRMFLGSVPDLKSVCGLGSGEDW